MNVLRIVVEVLALVGLAGIVCRLDALSWKTHQLAVVAMHVGMGVGCLWAILEAVEGVVTLGGAGAVVTTLCWLWTSFTTWAKGPPTHTMIHQPAHVEGVQR